MSEEPFRGRLTRVNISIHQDAAAPIDFEPLDGESVVFISVSFGETHVTVLSDGALMRSRWTANFGWSALEGLCVGADGFGDRDELKRALQGPIRRYGRPVSTEELLSSVRELMRNAVSDILDRTVGTGSAYDRIVIAAPAWLHGAFATCMDLRPHIWREIQDL